MKNNYLFYAISLVIMIRASFGYAETIVVSNTSDEGAGSLRQTMLYAGDNSGMNFPEVLVEKADATSVKFREAIDTSQVKKNNTVRIFTTPLEKNDLFDKKIHTKNRIFDQQQVTPSSNSPEELNSVFKEDSIDKTVSKSTGYITLDNEDNYFIPDLSSINIEFTIDDLLPYGAIITNIIYSIRIDDNSNESNFFPIDYDIYLTSDPYGHPSTLCVYDNQGDEESHTDEGFDDDTEDDSDIWLNYRSTDYFDGKDASKDFRIRVSDIIMEGEGLVDYVRIRISWEAPDLPNLDARFTPSGWDNPLTVTHDPDSHNDAPILFANAITYINSSFAVTDFDVPSAEVFMFKVYVDGIEIKSYGYPDGVIGIFCHENIEHAFTAGEHTVCQVVDPTEQTTEWNEDDNDYCRIMTWTGIPPVPSLSSPSDGAGCQPVDLTLSWNAAANATYYTLKVDNNSNFSSPVFSGIVYGTLQYITGLDNDTKYYWKVEAWNPAGPSSYSTTWYFNTITSVALSAPNLIGPPDGTICQPTTMSVYWAGVSDITHYNLEVDENSDFNSPVYSQNNIEAFSQEVSGLSAGTTYYWRVQSVNDCGNESEWSSSWNFTTTPTTIEPPSLIDPSDGSECQSVDLTLSWESMSHVQGYNLRVDLHDDFSDPEYGINTEYTSHTCEGLAESTIYYWRVSANSCGVDGTWSDAWSFETGSREIAAPLLTEPVNHSTSLPLAITLLWEAMTAATGYHFQLDDNNDFTSPLYSEEPTENSLQVSDLTGETTYYWHVRTGGKCSDSDWSETWQFNTAEIIDALIVTEGSGYGLDQNIPNPFSHSTEIRYTLPAAENVILKVIDLSSREVIRLVDGYQSEGNHSVLWDGKDIIGRHIPGGVYFYVLMINEYRITRKLLIDNTH